MSEPPNFEIVTEADRASRLLLHPLRVRILEAAREPASATEIGRRLGEARQKVNYHVRQLEDAGFLREAGRARRGNLEERRVVASAGAYLLLPEVLGPVGTPGGSGGEETSAGHLLALTARAQSELGRAWTAARARGGRVSTLSMDARVRLRDGAAREAFAAALREAVSAVVGRFADEGENAEAGDAFRLMLGVYPIPEAGEGSDG